MVTGKAGGPGYKEQNNTPSIFTDQDTISRFTAELIAEYIRVSARHNFGRCLLYIREKLEPIYS